MASASVRVFEVWLDSSLMLFLVDGVGRPPPFLDGSGADGEAEAALAAETFFDLEDGVCCAA